MMTDYKAIVEWIRDYTTSAGLKTLVADRDWETVFSF